MTDITTAEAYEAIVGNRPFLESMIGWEPVGRAARLVLLQNLNDEIARQQELWTAADTALDQLGLDPGVGVVAVTPVPTGNFHEGPHKSLIEGGPEMFPNVSVMAYVTIPSASQMFDQADSSDLTLFVETMAIAGPVTADGSNKTAIETIAHRRIQRMTEAVNNVIRTSANLLGAVLPIQGQPRGGIGSASVLKSTQAGKGPQHIWHGSRLQYTLQRNASFN